MREGWRSVGIRTTDEVELYAEVKGRGGDAILIPNRIFLFEPFAQLAQKHRVVFYDPRNRGKSEGIRDAEKLELGIRHDVEDMEAVREFFDFEKVTILAHSYLCTAAILYAMAAPEHVEKLILLGPVPPNADAQYPPDLKCEDAILAEFHLRMAQLQGRAGELTPEEMCEQFMAMIRRLNVVEAEDANRLRWDPCELPNEVRFMQPFLKYIMPSLTTLRLGPADYAKVTAPVMLIHGRKDRNSPYGASLDWARALPNARLVTIPEGAHVPWIEAPDLVRDSIDTFLAGSWPMAGEWHRARGSAGAD